jgi:UDP-N-acetyl-D-galactosamine dehydrogenase
MMINFSMLIGDGAKAGIIGLGYVSLPLAVEFGKVMPTVGFDINTSRIDELGSGKDSTLESGRCRTGRLSPVELQP